jgi:hypothetical protein
MTGMTERQQDLRRWLEAEDGSGGWDAADASFASVAAAWLPMSEAPAGLTERVMAAMPRTAETGWARALAGLMASWWVRGTVGAAVLILGAAVAVVPFGQFLTLGSVLTVAAAGGAAMLETISTAWHGCVAAWPVAVSLGQAAATVVATRTAALVMLINLVLATGAFAGLTRLLPVGEEES